MIPSQLTNGTKIKEFHPRSRSVEGMDERRNAVEFRVFLILLGLACVLAFLAGWKITSEYPGEKRLDKIKDDLLVDVDGYPCIKCSSCLIPVGWESKKLITASVSRRRKEALGKMGKAELEREFLEAVKKNNFRLVKFILSEYKLDLGKYEEAYILASQWAHPEILKTIEETPGVGESLSQSTKNTALNEACLHGRHEVVRHFLGLGLNINALDAGKKTPIFYAATGNHPHIVELLLENGADLTWREKDGYTAIANAVIFRACHSIPVMVQALNDLPDQKQAILDQAIQISENQRTFEITEFLRRSKGTIKA